LLPKYKSNNLDAQYDTESARLTAEVIADAQNVIAQIDAPAQAVARRHDELEADQVTLPRYAKTLRQLMRSRQTWNPCEIRNRRPFGSSANLVR